MACECVSCDWCHGSGHVWETTDGKIVRYRCDDMGDLAECPECEGRGIIECCYECAEAQYDDEL